MSYQQQFHSRLLQQLNEINSRNLELQLLLAQKDDQLSTLNARLSNALASPGSNGAESGSHASISQLQRCNADLLKQLDRAQGTAATAEGKLKTTASKFQKIETDLRKQVNELERELSYCKQQLGKVGSAPQQPRKSTQWTASTGVAPRAELDAANAEVKRLRSALSSLQKQREGTRLREFPVADPEKSRQLEDQDDEETVLIIKQEPIERQLAPPVSASTLKRATQPFDPRSRVEATMSATSAASKPNPAQPRKRSRPRPENAVVRPSPSKKARLERVASSASEESENDELDNDEEFSLDPAAPPPAKPSPPRSDVKGLQQRFEFQAVTHHHPSGDIDAFHSREDLSDECEELWARIKQQVDEWEEAKGEAWAFDFERPGARTLLNPPCVTTRLMRGGGGGGKGGKGGKTQWRAGCEGKFACKRCVREERPCFTWTGEEFWLLPLHEEDRKWPVEDGCEIRYWLNVE